MDAGAVDWLMNEVAKPGDGAAAHWSDKYLGRPYVRGEFDCADLVVEVARAEFGREVALPRHAEGVRARDKQIERLTGELGRPVELTAEPAEVIQDGDIVLMKAAGRRLSLGHHIGVAAVLSVGVAANLPLGVCVLHCLAGVGVVRHPIDYLPERGLERTGIYRWL